jgi:cytochrome c
MRKYLIVLTVFAGATILACNSGENKDGAKDPSSTEKKTDAGLSNNPDYQKGIELIGGNDCFTCHSVRGDRINGPTYEEVANKYAGMPDTIINYLAGKIIVGGSGNWAKYPEMTAHPTLSEEDARAMVKYILMLKTN